VTLSNSCVVKIFITGSCWNDPNESDFEQAL
jgi:hypothetical protein